MLWVRIKTSVQAAKLSDYYCDFRTGKCYSVVCLNRTACAQGQIHTLSTIFLINLGVYRQQSETSIKRRFIFVVLYIVYFTQTWEKHFQIVFKYKYKIHSKS